MCLVSEVPLCNISAIAPTGLAGTEVLPWSWAVCVSIQSMAHFFWMVHWMVGVCLCRPGHMRHMLLMSSYAVKGKGWRIVNVRSFSRGIVTTRVRKTVSLVGGMIGADANVCVGRLLLFC